MNESCNNCNSKTYVPVEPASNFPEEWRIVNASGPKYYNSEWEEYAITPLKAHADGMVIVVWERHIAPFTVERKIEQVTIIKSFE